MTFIKNAAKQRALDFGSTELSNEENGVSMSTTATSAEVAHQLWKPQATASEEKARGFFADQFEVGTMLRLKPVLNAVTGSLTLLILIEPKQL